MDPELFKKLKGRLAYDNVLIIKTGNSVLKFNSHTRTHARTHTHPCLKALSLGLPGSAGTRKVKII